MVINMSKKIKQQKKYSSRLWLVHIEVTTRKDWLFKRLTITDKNDKAILVSKKALSQIKECECLPNMTIECKQYKIDSKTVKQALIKCDDIKFTCTPNIETKWPNDVRMCIEKMCDGKCPYKIARLLFPNAYKDKKSMER